MRTAIIIQARTGSKRLPNKMMIEFFKGKGILEILVDRLQKAGLTVEIIIATTRNKNDNIIEQLAKKKKIKTFRGDESNVLKRFIDASEENNIEKIIRICADNIFLDMDALKYMIKEFDETTYDYWGYCLSNRKPAILSHVGFWAEAITLRALKKIIKVTDNKFYLEHVTNFLYLNPKEFNIFFYEENTLIKSTNGIRLTIDTLNDFKVVKDVYKTLIEKRIEITSKNVVEIVQQNIYWKKQMKMEIQKNEK